MARRGGPLRYLTGTAAQFGMSAPQQYNSSGLLLLLVGAYLLLAFVTGRLSWLTNTISDTFAAHDRYVPPASAANPTPNLPPPVTGSGDGNVAAQTANLPRPRTFATSPVHA